MKNQLQRKLKTKFIIFKGKYLRPKVFAKAFLILLVIFLLTPLFLYLIIYRGYSQKLITSVEKIPDELTTGVLIGDQNPEILKSLTDLAVESYQQRKLSQIYIYLINDSKSISDQDLLKLVDKIPAEILNINRDSSNPDEICKSTKEVYNLDKFIILSYQDMAVRTSFICNNQDVFAKAIAPSVNEGDLEVRSASLIDYLKDVLNVFSGGKLKF